MPRQYGWLGKPPKYHPALLAGNNFDPTTAPATLPTSADLSQFVTYLWDQRGGSCVGHGCWGAYACLANALNANNPNLPLTSPMFVYDWARMHDGSFPNDVGTYVASGIYALANQGIASNAVWYGESDPSETPSAAADSDAATRKIVTYLALDGSVLQIKQNIAMGYPVVCGFSVYESFEDSGPYIPVPPVGTNDAFKGGHCTYFTSYNDNLTVTVAGVAYTGWVGGFNSWGPTFPGGSGRPGQFFVPYAFFTSPVAACNDFWTIRAENDPIPSGKTVTTTTIASNAASVTGNNPTGTITVVATYSGDANNSASSATETITLGSPPSTWAVPPAASGTDASGAVWSLGAATQFGFQVLRNGASAAGGQATLLKYNGTSVFAQNSTGAWYVWQGNQWANSPGP